MDKCTIVGLSLEDPDTSCGDPKLTALLHDGWTIAAHCPAQRGNRTEWLMLLVPPIEKTIPKAKRNLLEPNVLNGFLLAAIPALISVGVTLLMLQP